MSTIQAILESYPAPVTGNAPALIQQAVGTNSVTISAPASGNSLIAQIAGGAADSITSITGGGVTWSKALRKAGSSTSAEIWYGHGSSGSGTTITLNRSGRSPGPMCANVSEWSGLNNAAPEATNNNSDVANAIVTTNSVTPSSTNALVVGNAVWTLNDYSTGPTNSFTRMTQTNITGAFIEEGYQIESSAIAYSTGWTLTAGIAWAATIAAFGAP